jgi:hypothetical protein
LPPSAQSFPRLVLAEAAIDALSVAAIFYIENEQVAVADNFIASTVNYHQQLWGRSLTINKALSYSRVFSRSGS